MSEQVADLGLDTDVPVRLEASPSADTGGLAAEDWFLWSRIDGRTSIRELFTLSGRARTETIASIRSLHDRGLIDLPGRERPIPLGGGKPHRYEVPELPRPTWFGEVDSFNVDPLKLESESVLPVELRRLLLYYHAYMRQVTYYDLFLVEPTVEKDVITTAYYRLSKVFHPDRWFRQPLGPFEEAVRDVFAWINKAYRTLSGSGRRQEYDQLLRRGVVGPWAVAEQSTAQSKARFTRGEATGHSLGRNALVARGRRMRADRQYRQAVSCFRRALKLGDDPRLALEMIEVQLEGEFDFPEALETVRRITAKSPTNYAARLLEARILKSMGARDDARKVCRAVLKEQPNHTAAKALLSELGAD